MQKLSETRRKINTFCGESGKYQPDAYEFITDCVINRISALSTARHLTALELLQALRKQLDVHFGALTGLILEEWKIHSASDIGEIVFDLIDLNILSAADDDKRSDFDIDYPPYPPAENQLQETTSFALPKIDQGAK